MLQSILFIIKKQGDVGRIIFMKTDRIFIVEDNLTSAKYLKTLLEKEGFEIVGIADSGKEAIEKLKVCDLDLVLMDIILKDEITGLDVSLSVMQMHPECKIIFLTADAEQEMIDFAVDVKAYAYLMKPYREKEIVATVRMALLHKTEKTKQENRSFVTLRNGYRFDLKHNQLEKDGTAVALSPTMLKMIRLLALNHDNVVSTKQLNIHIWNKQKNNSTLRSLINRFRNSVDKNLIISVNSVGYMVKSDKT